MPAKPAREVTSSEVRLLGRFYEESLGALKRVRDLFRNELKRADVPRYPESAEGVQAVLARWAHR